MFQVVPKKMSQTYQAFGVVSNCLSDIMTDAHAAISLLAASSQSLIFSPENNPVTLHNGYLKPKAAQISNKQ